MISQAIADLFNNPAFWVFLGTCVTSYYTYKAVIKRTPAGKAQAQVRNATSFEELRAVVEVLQQELIDKDKRHKADTEYMLLQLREAREEVRQLAIKLANAAKENARCLEKIADLNRLLDKHEQRLNKARIPVNGD